MVLKQSMDNISYHGHNYDDIRSLMSAATLYEASGKQGALPCEIKPLSPNMRVLGPALTVLSVPGDNRFIHKAIYEAKPGDVLIAYVGGNYEYGYWGEIMTRAAIKRELAGVVIDGCVRDAAEIKKLDFPLFSRGLCIIGTEKNKEKTGSIAKPIRIGDIKIESGDLIAGDEDGIVVIPQELIEQTLENAGQREKDEAKIIRQLENGASTLDIYRLK